MNNEIETINKRQTITNAKGDCSLLIKYKFRIEDYFFNVERTNERNELSIVLSYILPSERTERIFIAFYM
jgi:hypothetical protein